MRQSRRQALARNRGRVAAALAMLILLPGALFAQQATRAPDSLSLDQALRLARENSPVFLQQKNDVDVATSAVQAAYGNLFPSANISNGYGYTAKGEARSGVASLGQYPASYSSSYQLSLNYQLSGASILAPSLQRANKRATESRVFGAAANLDAQVTQQYLTVLQSREQVTQAEREVERAKEQERLAQAKLDVGAGTPLEVHTTAVTEGQAEVALLQARNTATVSVLTLGQIVGVPIDTAVALTSEFTVFQPTWDVDQLIQMALQNNPNLLAARASVDAARTSVKSARTSYLPSLGFNVGWRGSVYSAGNVDPLIAAQLAGMKNSLQQCLDQNLIRGSVGLAPNTCADPSNPAVQEQVRRSITEANSGFPFDYDRQPLSASVSISLPIFQGLSRKLQVDQAQANATDARQEVRAQELQLRLDIGTGLRNLQTAYQTTQLQEEVRANAAEQLRLAEERFRFGAANIIEVTDAQRALAQAEQDQITAVYDFHKSLATLEALVGRSLR